MPPRPLGSAHSVTLGLDQYGDGDGFWALGWRSRENALIFTQIILGLHLSLYRREVNFPCGFWKRYRWEAPERGRGVGAEANRKSELLILFWKKKNLQKNKMGYIVF